MMKKILLFLILEGSLLSAQDRVNFSFTSEKAKSVYLTGSFNQWNKKALPLKKNGNTFSIDLYLPDGYYYYKFMIDGSWISDPNNDWKINDGGDNFNSIIKVGNPPPPQRLLNPMSMPVLKLPRPVLTDNPEWIELYYKAWELAWNKLKAGTAYNGFSPLYMDEGFNELIYQWDSNFMAAFAVYGRAIFPAMAAMDNFYKKQRSDGYIQRVYWETSGSIVNSPTKDEPMINPPLFAWIELKNYKITGDIGRLKNVYPYLIRYYNWIESNMKSTKSKGLYYNTSLGSGMDNTPREGVGKGIWVDFSSQQALAAKCLAEIGDIISSNIFSNKFRAQYDNTFQLINTYCWNPQDKFYYDVREDEYHSFTKHIGAFWTLISNTCPVERYSDLISSLTNPDEFWRPHLIPTLSALDLDYDESGHYWRGGVWAPTNYMVIKGLEQYGDYSLANRIAINHLENIYKIYSEFTPDEGKIAFEERYSDGYKTIWECYSPENPEPATRWDDTFYSRQDFVGWSGLGPIAMLIENILGFEIRGDLNKIIWRINRDDKHGIENIQLGNQFVSLLCTPKDEILELEISCKKEFTLEIFWVDKYYTKKITPGYSVFSL